MTDTDKYLLRSIALAGGPEQWARDMFASVGVPSEIAAERFASIWLSLSSDSERLQLGAYFVAAINAYDGPRVCVDREAKERIVASACAAGAAGGDA